MIIINVSKLAHLLFSVYVYQNWFLLIDWMYLRKHLFYAPEQKWAWNEAAKKAKAMGKAKNKPENKFGEAALKLRQAQQLANNLTKSQSIEK